MISTKCQCTYQLFYPPSPNNLVNFKISRISKFKKKKKKKKKTQEFRCDTAGEGSSIVTAVGRVTAAGRIPSLAQKLSQAVGMAQKSPKRSLTTTITCADLYEN